MNSYLNDQKAIDRLYNEYKKYKRLIIGFDFDCTIYDYHNENLEVQPIIDLLREASDLNFVMCLHTLSLKYNDLVKKEDYTKKLGINVHYINTSPILSNSYPIEFKKPFYSILLDDRAGLSSSYNILKETIKKIKNEFNN
jgi:hypothetical protein